MSRDSTKAERFWRHLEPLQGPLETYCRRCVYDASTVEDVLQEAVATALRDFDLFVEDEWLLAFDESHFAALLDSPEQVLEKCDEALAAAISRLNPLERSSLLLKAVGGFKYREISDVLGQPMGTVMSALARARKRLRHELAEFARDRRLLNVEGERNQP